MMTSSLILGTSLWHPITYSPLGLEVMGIDPIHTEERLSARSSYILSKDYVETDIYKVLLSNGVELKASLDSRFEVRVANGPWKVLRLREILTWFPPMIAGEPRSCGCKQKPLLESRYELRQILYYIPFTKFNQGFPPYWLGVFINRGCIQCDKSYVSVEPELALRMRHQDTWDFYLEDVPIHKNGITPDPVYSSTYTYFLNSREGINTDVERELKNLEVWGKSKEDRYIHPSYLFSGFYERVALLQGIMDSSGYVDPIDGVAKARIKSERLVDDLIFLVRTLGGYARQVNTGCNTFPYLVEVYPPDPEYPFSRPSIAKLWKRQDIEPPPLYIDSVQLDKLDGYLLSIQLNNSEAYIDENFLPVRPIAFEG